MSAERGAKDVNPASPAPRQAGPLRFGGVLGTRMAAAGLVAGATILNGRTLGTAEFGTLIVVLAVISFTGTLGAAGLGRFAMKELGASTSRDDQGAVARSILRSQILAGLCAGVVSCLIVALLVTTSSAVLLASTFVGALLASRLQVMTDILRSTGLVVVPTLLLGRSGAPVQLFAGSLFAFLVTQQRDLEPRAETVIVAIATVGLALSVAAQLAIQRLLPASNVDRRVNRFAGTTFLGAQIAARANGEIDLWLGAIFLTDARLGIYAGASRLVGLAILPYQSIQQMTLPRLRNQFVGGRLDELQSEISKLGLASALLSLPALLLFVAFPGWVLNLAYNDEAFREGAIVLALLAVGQAVNVATGLGGSVLLMSGEERRVMAIGLLGTAITAVIALLTPRFGLSALAAAAAIGSSIGFVSLSMLCSKTLGVKPWVGTRVVKNAASAVGERSL